MGELNTETLDERMTFQQEQTCDFADAARELAPRLSVLERERLWDMVGHKMRAAFPELAACYPDPVRPA